MSKKRRRYKASRFVPEDFAGMSKNTRLLVLRECRHEMLPSYVRCVLRFACIIHRDSPLLPFASCALCVHRMRDALPTRPDVPRPPPYPAPAAIRAEPVCLSGSEPAERGDFDRGEPESGQGLQLRLHLLPGRSDEPERNAVRRDRATAGRAGRHAAPGGQRRDFHAREVPRYAARISPSERHRLLRRRRADDATATSTRSSRLVPT